MKFKPFGKIGVNLDFRISYNGILASIRSIRDAFVRLWNRISRTLAGVYQEGLSLTAHHTLWGNLAETTYSPSHSVIEAQTVRVELTQSEVELMQQHIAREGNLEVIKISDAGIEVT